jgi:hypothetical protein
MYFIQVQREEPCTLNPAATNGVILYTGVNYTGSCNLLTEGDHNSFEAINNNVDSVKFTGSYIGNYQLTLYKDFSYLGGEIYLFENVPDLDKTWLGNNEMSSAKLHPRTYCARFISQGASETNPAQVPVSGQTSVLLTFENACPNPWPNGTGLFIRDTPYSSNNAFACPGWESNGRVAMAQYIGNRRYQISVPLCGNGQSPQIYNPSTHKPQVNFGLAYPGYWIPAVSLSTGDRNGVANVWIPLSVVGGGSSCNTRPSALDQYQLYSQEPS